MTRAQAGYTLLELLVVLGIMALIAVIAVPTVASSVERMTLSSDVRVLTTELRRLRERALDRQADVSVAVSGAAGNLLMVSDGSSISLTEGTRAEISPGSNGINVPPRFTIVWDGTMTGAVRLSRGGSSARIVADRLTGRVAAEIAQ